MVYYSHVYISVTWCSFPVHYVFFSPTIWMCAVQCHITLVHSVLQYNGGKTCKAKLGTHSTATATVKLSKNILSKIMWISLALLHPWSYFPVLFYSWCLYICNLIFLLSAFCPSLWILLFPLTSLFLLVMCLTFMFTKRATMWWERSETAHLCTLQCHIMNSAQCIAVERCYNL